jgi:hypothetical protein
MACFIRGPLADVRPSARGRKLAGPGGRRYDLGPEVGMFKILKVLLWTAGAVGLGVFLARYEVDGRTPVEHAESAWKPGVDGLRDKLDDARQTLAEKAKKNPHASYSEDERAAIDRIIAQGKAK